MAATILDGQVLAARIRAGLADEAKVLAARGVPPGLAVVLVGEDPASQIYVRNKTKACAEAGFRTFDHKLPADTSEAALLQLVARLNADPNVDGILVQLPLPKQIDSSKVLLSISPAKDVDGFHPDNLGRLLLGKPRFVACTPFGIIKLIEEAGVDIAGANAVVVGRSNIVGKPVAVLLTARDATVTLCHSKTRDLPAVVRSADILVAAIGKAEMIRGDWVKPGATVIDVGTNRLDSGKLVGDVEFAAAAERAGAITPVPGGVGPMTITMLLHNTLLAARRRLARR
ncbi:MAG TPA: bifunctional methylenetetrahydrofolate dehydrogenase/methenyltetrahydrofolate cyclohydrolase FolD, partial [Actinomycetota bacterium]|nr:bifunctional methylenetetrahydrofolate dehydrogenase/methenyltetrahydrofolate cyclohydrolase FolD [Actinomycetota bacterium]